MLAWLTSSLSPSARRSSIPRRRPLILHRLHHALHLHLAAALQANMPGRSDQLPAIPHNRRAASAAKTLAGADKTGHKRGPGVQIEILRGIHLLNAPVVKHRHAIRHRQRFALVVGHEDEG